MTAHIFLWQDTLCGIPGWATSFVTDTSVPCEKCFAKATKALKARKNA